MPNPQIVVKILLVADPSYKTPYKPKALKTIKKTVKINQKAIKLRTLTQLTSLDFASSESFILPGRIDAVDNQA